MRRAGDRPADPTQHQDRCRAGQGPVEKIRPTALHAKQDRRCCSGSLLSKAAWGGAAPPIIQPEPVSWIPDLRCRVLSQRLSRLRSSHANRRAPRSSPCWPTADQWTISRRIPPDGRCAGRSHATWSFGTVSPQSRPTRSAITSPVPADTPPAAPDLQFQRINPSSPAHQSRIRRFPRGQSSDSRHRVVSTHHRQRIQR